jgi:hypothetical protein
MNRKIAPTLTAMVADLHPLADEHWTTKKACAAELRALLAVARAAAPLHGPDFCLPQCGTCRALSRLTPSAKRGRAKP